MCEVESIINSRPLTVISSDVKDPLPLSPNQILTMKTSVVLPPPGQFQRNDVYMCRRWLAVTFELTGLLFFLPALNDSELNWIVHIYISLYINIVVANRRCKVQQQHSSTRSNQKHTLAPLAATIWSTSDLGAQLTASWNELHVGFRWGRKTLCKPFAIASQTLC